MRPLVLRWLALVAFPPAGGGNREFLIYGRSEIHARRCLNVGEVSNLNAETSALIPTGTIEQLGGKVISVLEMPELPKAKYLVDRAPSRETRS